MEKEIDKSKIVDALSDVGTIEVLSIKDKVFTFFIRGAGMDTYNKVSKVHSVITENISHKYQTLEVMVNDVDYMILVLTPKI